VYRAAGLNPSQYESSGRRRDGGISREGSVPLRRALGNIALQELNAAHLNRLYADLLRAGLVREGGLSPTTVRRIHSMLRKALNDAARWGRVQRNVVMLADPPPMKAVQAARRRGMRTWTEGELRQFLDATNGHELHDAWMFAASTGVRRSELLGSGGPT
jgi:integrase